MAFTLEDRVPRVQVSLTASTGPITLDFEFFDENDIDVIRDDGVTDPVTSIDQADFTVTGTPSDDGIAFESGSVTLNSAFTGTVTCIRNLAIDRLTQQPVAGKFLINSLNVALSRIYAILQEQRLDLDRAFRLLPEDPLEEFLLPDVDTRKGMFLWFDSITGDPSVATTTDGAAAIDADLLTWLANIDTNDLILGDDTNITTKTGDLDLYFDETNNGFDFLVSGTQILSADVNALTYQRSTDGVAFSADHLGANAVTNDISTRWQLNDSTDTITTFGNIKVTSSTVTDTAEDGTMDLEVIEDGTLTTYLTLDGVNKQVTAAKALVANGGFAIGDDSELTIATGSITPTDSYHNVDTEADAASDDLTDIDDANLPVNSILVLRANNGARDVVVKHTASGNHKIVLADAQDYTLDDAAKSVVLQLRAGGEWHEIARSGAIQVTGQGGQIKVAQSTAGTNITTAIPHDNTIPQNTEGAEITTVSITPQNAASTILIEWVVMGSLSTNGTYATSAIFVDSTASALTATAWEADSSAATAVMSGMYSESAGSTTARTYKLRAGPSSGTFYLNESAAGAALYGAAGPHAMLKVTEILP